MIEMIPVESSNLQAVGYDPATQVLSVQFKNGGVYEYADVPAQAHAGLMAAASKGSYLASVIKPNYRATRLPPEPKPEPADASDAPDRDEGEWR